MSLQARSEPPIVRTALAASDLRASAWPSVIGMGAVALVLIFSKLVFGPVVKPPWLLDGWLAVMACIIAFWAVASVIYARRSRPDVEVADRWLRLGQGVRIALNAGIIVGPWILLPHATPPLLSVMLLNYVWYVAASVMVSATSISIAEVMLLMASVSGVLLWMRTPLAPLLAFFLMTIGASMLALRSLVRRAVARAVEERVASERAEAETRVALAATAAERDAKTRFIAAASHDLQQPLHAAGLFFENAIGAPDATARERAVAGARRAFASTQALIGQMLDHLRLEAGAVSARLEVVDLGGLIEAQAIENGPAAAAAGMRVIGVASRQTVLADPTLLRAAAGNLVTNAIRHAKGERVLVGVRRRGDVARLWVVDDGVGLGDEDAERLFDAYAQGRASAGGAKGGFGLGLSSARRAAALMGGDLGLDARWTGGCAFFIELPRTSARAEPADREAQPAWKAA